MRNDSPRGLIGFVSFALGLVLAGSACSSGGSGGAGGASTGGAATGGRGGEASSGGTGGPSGAAGEGGSAGSAAGGGAAGVAGAGGKASATGGGNGGATSPNGGSSGQAGGAGGGDQDGVCALTATHVVTLSLANARFHRLWLSAPDGFQALLYSLNTISTPIASCAPELPPCHTASLIDLADVTAALANPDVTAAFAATSSPRYNDPDGEISIVRAGDNRALTTSLSCTVGTVDCKVMPEGVRALVNLIRKLAAQQLAEEACGPVRSP